MTYLQVSPFEKESGDSMGRRDNFPEHGGCEEQTRRHVGGETVAQSASPGNVPKIAGRPWECLEGARQVPPFEPFGHARQPFPRAKLPSAATLAHHGFPRVWEISFFPITRHPSPLTTFRAVRYLREDARLWESFPEVAG